MPTDPYATAADLGLMQGFPPAPERRVTRTNALMTPPFNRWSYQHMRTIYPSAPIRRGDVPIPLAVSIDDRIGDLAVRGVDGEAADLVEVLRTTYTDALVVVTRDHIVHESYMNGMTADQPHQMMSVTKSFAGLLGLMAVDDGALREDEAMTAVVPELASASAFADATFGHVLDMVNSMDFDEDYADPHSAIIRYGQTLGWLQAPADAYPADSVYDFLVSLEHDPAHAHGDVFHYQTPKTDALNWATNRATGTSFQDHLSDALWSRLGTDGDTYVLLDRNGTLVAGGGLNAGPRNLARFAMMMLNGGAVDGDQIVPRRVIDTIAAGASREAFAAGPDATGPLSGGDWSYRAQWWVRHTPGREAFTAMGIHGQWIYIDITRGVAVVKQSSQPVSLDLAMDQVNLDLIDAIIDLVAS
ncbi:serine hydrolase [Microbacter sp. GSS18]|nr:serine hydrolase [Microbacter sp. GSS18]